MTASPNRTTSRHWWRDQIARLIITVIGGVAAALILVYVIPAVSNSDSDAESPDTQTEQPADNGGSETPAETDPPPPAEGE